MILIDQICSDKYKIKTRDPITYDIIMIYLETKFFQNIPVKYIAVKSQT